MVIRNGYSAHDFVVWLFAELRRRKISQADFAKSIGVSESVVSRWRWNKQGPSWPMISKVLRSLDHHFEIVPDKDEFDDVEEAKDRNVNKVIRAFERYEGREPIEEKNDYTSAYLCGECMNLLSSYQRYCWKCGRKIKWKKENENGNQEV